jgi:DNA polymerase-3 subunit alpha
LTPKGEKMGTYWSAHTHSKFSVGDALPGVSEIVEKAKELNYPALGLTDHGNISGTVQLYKHCRKNDIKPLPGSELYLSWDIEENKRNKKKETVHLGVLATSAKGYKNLVYLSSLSHFQYYHKPTLDFNDLAHAYENGMLEGLAVMTGCWFGMASEILKIPSKNVDIQINNVLKTMSKWFDNNLYVEIQNHGIQKDSQDEDAQAELMYQLAQSNSLPIVITQDSHYVEQDEQHLHDVLKNIISWDKTEGAAIFPGDGYHLVDDKWMQMYHPKHIYDAGIQGLDDLYNKSNVVIKRI